MRTQYTWNRVSTPIGELTVVGSRTGLLRLVFGGPRKVLPEFAGSDLRADEGFAAMAAEQVLEYFDGRRRHFDLPLDWSLTEGWQSHVLHTLFGSVPFGTTRSYQELAGISGRPNAARVVGTIMGSNPIPVVVPCHRVVASGGGLGGFGGGLEIKRRLLVLEGSLAPTLLELDVLPEPGQD